MNYRIEVWDTWGRRVAAFDEVPLLKATRTAPDRSDSIRGILPGKVTDLGHGYRIRVLVEGALFMEAFVTDVRPQWSDTRKLILDRFVHFHEVIEFEARVEASDGNGDFSRAFANRTVDQIVRSAINSTLGPVHYLVDHTVYPDGAQRESAKFLARKMAGNELEIGGILTGQWVDSTRIDATGASAKDGDTIQGLVVDGVVWPDLRLMLFDSEETTLNSHTTKLHGEVAGWTDAQYAASGYKVKADAATVFLQSLMDTKGIDFIELNPHKDAEGAFDDRIDAFGRYLGFVYGGGECFNAAQVENGHGEVLLFSGGKFHVPEMELKDYFSYTRPNTDSIEASTASLVNYDVTGGLFEVLTALSYVASGFVWSVDAEMAVHFRQVTLPDQVIFFDPLAHGALLSSNSEEVANGVVLKGNPVTSTVDKLYTNQPSIDEYDFQLRFLEYFSITVQEDGDKLMAGLMDDVPYPEPSGEVTFFRGEPSISVGDVIEFRDGDLRRLTREVAGEWADTFTGKLIGRVKSLTHEFRGRLVTTKARLTSPLRSVENPISFIVRGQPLAETLFQFRLDEATVGLDLGYHLD